MHASTVRSFDPISYLFLARIDGSAANNSRYVLSPATFVATFAMRRDDFALSGWTGHAAVRHLRSCFQPLLKLLSSCFEAVTKRLSAGVVKFLDSATSGIWCFA
jgi:hypothetical protein